LDCAWGSAGDVLGSTAYGGIQHYRDAMSAFWCMTLFRQGAPGAASVKQALQAGAHWQCHDMLVWEFDWRFIGALWRCLDAPHVPCACGRMRRADETKAPGLPRLVRRACTMSRTCLCRPPPKGHHQLARSCAAVRERPSAPWPPRPWAGGCSCICNQEGHVWDKAAP